MGRVRRVMWGGMRRGGVGGVRRGYVGGGRMGGLGEGLRIYPNNPSWRPHPRLHPFT